VERSLKGYDYVAAQEQLHSLVRPRDLSAPLRRRVNYLRSICQSLTAWDVFDHSQALECIEGDAFTRSPKLRSRLLQPLKRLVGLRTWLAEGGPLPAQTSGYELVEDLQLNAGRRAQSGRYDDAVGRYYRALEMLAQMRLKLHYGVDTSAVSPEHIPEPHRAKYLSPKLGLRQAYELLQDLQDPIVGPIYEPQSKLLLNALNTRNASLFAHGYQPIGKREYELFLGFACGFLNELLGKLFGKSDRISQLPSSIDEISD